MLKADPHINTANITPSPATVTTPPPCANSAAAPPVACTVAEDDVLVLEAFVEFDLPVALPLAPLAVSEAPPFPFPVFVDVELAELIPDPPVARDPEASVDVAFPCFVFDDVLLMLVGGSVVSGSSYVQSRWHP